MNPFSISVHNSLPLERKSEPVSLGVPFARGSLKNAADLQMQGPDGAPVLSQATATGLWHDGSVRWATLRFLADLAPGADARFRVSLKNGKAKVAAKDAAPAPLLKGEKEPTRVNSDTGVLRFSMDGGTFRGFEMVQVPRRNGEKGWATVATPTSMGSIYLKDKDGRLFTALWGKVNDFTIEENGPLAVQVRFEGTLADENGQSIAEYDLWVQAWAGQATIRTFLTLRNPRIVSRRVLGQWSLGNVGSLYFKEAGWRLNAAREGVSYACVHGGPELSQAASATGAYDGSRFVYAASGEVYRGPFTQQASIVQDSSGGQNWFHRNHVNRDWRIPLSYKGFKAFVDGKEVRHGDRADAWVSHEDPSVGVAVGVRHGWQNFPKALRVSAGEKGKPVVTAALWPEEFDDVHEMVGGEQKTHELVFHFYRGDGMDSPKPYSRWPETADAMARALHPAVALAESAHYAASGVFDHMGLYDDKRGKNYELVCSGSVSCETDNLFIARERYDEYGWRSFGDVCSDDEIDGRLFRHYNLEYDMGYAMLIQTARTASARPDLSRKWWELAGAALRHEADIDVYHAANDPHCGGVYSGGKFSHTDHGVEPGRCGHRIHEEENIQGGFSWGQNVRGGAPESEHMGSRGMATYGWMGAYPPSLKVAKGMADLVYFKVNTKHFPQIGDYYRNSGHNLQILTEGFFITGDRKYREAGAKIVDVSHPDQQPWYNGFPFKPTGQAAHGDAMLLWAGGILLKEVARYQEISEAETGKSEARALSFILEAAERYNQWGWDESLGRYAHSVRPAGDHQRYGEPWWDLKVLDVVVWACRWQKDKQKRKLWMERARRNFEEAGKLLTNGSRKPVYRRSKGASVSAQNGVVFLALERQLSK